MEQRSIDVVVRVIAPDGKTLYEVDSPNGTQGDETATVFATEVAHIASKFVPFRASLLKGNIKFASTNS